MNSLLVTFNDTAHLHPIFYIFAVVFTTLAFVFFFSVGIKLILSIARSSKKLKLAFSLLTFLFSLLMISFLAPIACTVTKVDINSEQDWILKNELNLPIGVIASSTPRSITVEKALGIMTNPTPRGRGRNSYNLLIKTQDRIYQSVTSIDTPLLYGGERTLREQAAKQNVSTQVSSDAYNFNTIVAYSRYVLFVLLVIAGVTFWGKKNHK